MLSKSAAVNVDANTDRKRSDHQLRGFDLTESAIVLADAGLVTAGTSNGRQCRSQMLVFVTLSVDLWLSS
jgi:hypothetical protein